MSVFDKCFGDHERTALFINGTDFFGSHRFLGFDVDYGQLLNLFSESCHLVRAYYYVALIAEEDEFVPLKPLVDWLSYNGYAVRSKEAEVTFSQDGQRHIRHNMDLDMAVDMLELSDKIDHAVLFSGDGDFRRLIEALQRRGVRVTVVSTIGKMSDLLRRQADQFIDLRDMKPLIARSLKEGATNPSRMTLRSRATERV